MLIFAFFKHDSLYKDLTVNDLTFGGKGVISSHVEPLIRNSDSQIIFPNT